MVMAMMAMALLVMMQRQDGNGDDGDGVVGSCRRRRSSSSKRAVPCRAVRATCSFAMDARDMWFGMDGGQRHLHPGRVLADLEKRLHSSSSTSLLAGWLAAGCSRG